MRLIYTDEAGTSAQEPVSVVASVLVHGDRQWRILEEEIRKAIACHVPDSIREGFWIHATEIYSGGKTVKRDEWPLEERLDFLKSILCIPFVHDAPIALGVQFKKPLQIKDSSQIKIARQAHHLAFAKCMKRVDWFLRGYLGGAENGIVIAEDEPNMRQFLVDHGLILRDKSLKLESSDFNQTRLQSLLDIAPESFTYEIKYIIDHPHFIKKKNAGILQIADACSFAFRHFLSGKRFGEDLILAMLGPSHGEDFIKDPAWFSGGSSGLFNTEAYWSEEQRLEFHSLRTEALRRAALGSN